MSINTERLLIVGVTLVIVGVLMAVQLGKLGEQMVVVQEMAEELEHDRAARQATVEKYIEINSSADIGKEGIARR